MMYDRPIRRHNIWRIHPQLRKSYSICISISVHSPLFPVDSARIGGHRWHSGNDDVATTVPRMRREHFTATLSAAACSGNVEQSRYELLAASWRQPPLLSAGQCADC